MNAPQYNKDIFQLLVLYDVKKITYKVQIFIDITVMKLSQERFIHFQMFHVQSNQSKRQNTEGIIKRKRQQHNYNALKNEYLRHERILRTSRFQRTKFQNSLKSFQKMIHSRKELIYRNKPAKMS